ncbi:DUF6416 domain-containing protein [Streptomyces tanashiensis]|uniref:DUF6416 domain-containing protein n=1 Tax=Streptomyces tanashiensis TaxID=67367 RepID=A0ABY6QRY3_9ACTN|nr:DUF6416 domain-containing protein [Streptomyces tanashiensis]UZX20241.1 DUF6416 domain-containing protein [Streptomyces tanashiensis]GGY45540.1 hypothetical protein GCM10010299_59840 [Streptomyces tanashiensis]
MGKPDGQELPFLLEDSAPAWARHSGGPGHDGPDWEATDLDRAVAYYEALSPTARMIFDHLRATPGRRVSCDELVRRFGLNPDGTKNNPHVVAGHMNTTGRARKESGRRYPFFWWAGKDGVGATYAVRRSVAEIFESALKA